MPTTTKMDGTDLDITDTKSSTVTGGEAVAAIVNARVQTAVGEWYADRHATGLPLWQFFLINSPSPHLMEKAITEAIQGADPALTVTNVVLDVDPDDPRTLKVTWEGEYDGATIGAEIET
ncbi:MAG: hypothetical protein B7733_05830 [Myxococcales bacterium FL481]|nr:MAG: hypothetical protein B7733_05830 [Myxococcales bacterium FL481]